MDYQQNNNRISGTSAASKQTEYLKARQLAQKRRAMLEAEKQKHFGKSNPAYGFNPPRPQTQNQAQKGPSQHAGAYKGIQRNAAQNPARNANGMQNPIPAQNKRPPVINKNPQQSSRPSHVQTHIAPPRPDARRINYHNPRDVERLKQNQRSDAKAEELRKQLGKKPDPQKKINQNRQSYTGANKPQRNQPVRPANPERAKKNEWVIPEGSNIYTEYKNHVRTAPDARRPENQVGRNHISKAELEKRKAELAKRKEEEKAEREKIRKEKTRRIVYVSKRFLYLFLAMLIVFSAIGFWRYRSVYYSKDGSSGSVTYTYVYSDDKVTSSKSAPAYSFRNGIQYVNFNELAKLFDMSKVGSVQAIRYISADNTLSSEKTGKEQSVNFTNDKKIAVVNGTNIVLENLCKIQGENVWVPLSFATNYINGLSAEKDRNGNVTFILDVKDSKDVSFKVSSSVPLKSIEYDKDPSK